MDNHANIVLLDNEPKQINNKKMRIHDMLLYYEIIKNNTEY